MQNIPTMEDGVTSLLAAFFNQIPDEIENAIISSGQTLDPGAGPITVTQLAKAIAAYAVSSSSYSDSGTADAYVLTTRGSKQPAPAYAAGMVVKFSSFNNNLTTSPTVNVDGLGVKNILTPQGGAVSVGSIEGDVELIFQPSLDAFTQVYGKSPGQLLQLGQLGSPSSDAFRFLTTENSTAAVSGSNIIAAFGNGLKIYSLSGSASPTGFVNAFPVSMNLTPITVATHLGASAATNITTVPSPTGVTAYTDNASTVQCAIIAIGL